MSPLHWILLNVIEEPGWLDRRDLSTKTTEGVYVTHRVKIIRARTEEAMSGYEETKRIPTR